MMNPSTPGRCNPENRADSHLGASARGNSVARREDQDPGIPEHLIATALVALPQGVVHRSTRAAEKRGLSLESFLGEALEAILPPVLEPENLSTRSIKSPFPNEVETLFRTGRLVKVQGYPPLV